MIYNTLIVFIVIGSIAAGILLGYALRQRLSDKKLESSENLSARIIDEAKKEAETIKKEALLQAKENLLKTKTEFEKDSKESQNGNCCPRWWSWLRLILPWLVRCFFHSLLLLFVHIIIYFIFNFSHFYLYF